MVRDDPYEVSKDELKYVASQGVFDEPIHVADNVGTEDS
jgi:hypothetical protein